MSEAEFTERYIRPAMEALIQRAAAGTLTEDDRHILAALPSGRLLLQDQQNDFVATYERPELARQSIMSCGHTAAEYDSSGRCMRCAAESSAFTDAYRRSIIEHVGGNER